MNQIKYVYYAWLCYVCLISLYEIGGVANHFAKRAVVRAFNLDHHRKIKPKKSKAKDEEPEILEAELISVETIG